MIVSHRADLDRTLEPPVPDPRTRADLTHEVVPRRDPCASVLVDLEAGRPKVCPLGQGKSVASPTARSTVSILRAAIASMPGIFASA